ncbi:hypothetical protein ABT282_38285, partial [Streptomyces sp. NPDC000927]
ETAGAGLAAAGIEPALLPPAPALSAAGPDEFLPELPHAGPQTQPQPQAHPQALAPQQHQEQQGHQGHQGHPEQQQQQAYGQQPGHPQQYEQQQPQHARPGDHATAGEWPQDGPGSHESPWFAASPVPNDAHRSAYDPTYVEGLEPMPVQVPLGPGGRTRPLGNVGTIGVVPEPRTTASRPMPQAEHDEQAQQAQHAQQAPQTQRAQQAQQAQHAQQTHQAQQAPQPAPAPEEQQAPAQAQQEEPAPESGPEVESGPETGSGPEAEVEPGSEVESGVEFGTVAYQVFAEYTRTHQAHPSAEVLDIHLSDVHNIHHPRGAALLRRMLPGFKQRFDNEMAENHIA